MIGLNKKHIQKWPGLTLKLIFNAAWFMSCAISVLKSGWMTAKRSWTNSSRYINRQAKKKLQLSCTNSMPNGIKLIAMSSKVWKKLSQICWSSTIIPNKSELQFIQPTWLNPLTTSSSVKLSLKQNFQLNSRLMHLLASRQWATMTAISTEFIKALVRFRIP